MSEQTEAKAERKPRVALWIATGFGLGYLPVAPGTWGSLGGVALSLLIPSLLFMPLVIEVDLNMSVTQLLYTAKALQWGLAVAVALVGVWASQRTAIYMKKSDPGQVVVDEISGQMLTFLFAAPTSGLLLIFNRGNSPIEIFSANWKYVVLGFILFRVFDIWKPWPIRRAEKLPGGWGIMADDWVAGAYAAFVLWVVRWQGWIG
ncbi:MAG: phosphatidylglycerophosphatase A [Acidobacteria bacterium]|nr:phosphatidylglycerophosphatase A [Acidobacteriota bacterium]MCL5287658.1 phosphatidylglycerophosphatase A [Acidobacteriota bacterium]